MEEIWKDIYYVDSISGEIIDYRGIYQVSNLGRVKSLERTARVCGGGFRVIKERILKGWIDNNGYLLLTLKKDKKDKKFRVHRLVAHMFIPNPDNKPEVDHINTDRCDNDVNNLRWVTRKENHNNPITKEHHKGKKDGRDCRKTTSRYFVNNYDYYI